MTGTPDIDDTNAHPVTTLEVAGAVINDGATKVENKTGEAVSKAGEAVSSATSWGHQQVSNVGKEVHDGIVDGFKSVGSSISEGFSSLWYGILHAIGRFLQLIGLKSRGDWFESIGNKTKDTADPSAAPHDPAHKTDTPSTPPKVDPIEALRNKSAGATLPAVPLATNDNDSSKKAIPKVVSTGNADPSLNEQDKQHIEDLRKRLAKLQKEHAANPSPERLASETPAGKSNVK